MHLYQQLSLPALALGIGIFYLFWGTHLFFKWNSTLKILQSLARNQRIGGYLMTFNLVWLFLLFIPTGWGKFSFLALDFAELNMAKIWFLFIFPVIYFRMYRLFPDFLFVRALGVFLLLLAHPLLETTLIRDPASLRILVSIFAYVMVIKGIMFVAKPYLYRDMLNMLAKGSSSRVKYGAVLAIIYSLVMIVYTFV